MKFYCSKSETIFDHFIKSLKVFCKFVEEFSFEEGFEVSGFCLQS
jgi:hypothetical protein